MRGRFTILFLTILLVSCGKDEFRYEYGIDYSYGKELTHDRIVLGDRLENPYKKTNMQKALQSLYPTRADRIDLKTTDLYVRFLPADESEYDLLADLGVEMIDHPMDYEITVEGDWYHDPDIPDGEVTWQYAVVPPDFEFPPVHYEIIDECYISENDPGTRSDPSIDWSEVEREAFVLTGNQDYLQEASLTKASGKECPSGRITIVDRHSNEGKPFGVAGVRVSCNSFVKFDHAYTDRDGYYTMNKSFASNPRYRLIFKNSKGFSIGFNLVLVPASVSTLGKASPSGVNMTVTEASEKKLFRRCAVNNAVYDYLSRCDRSDLDILSPPSGLNIWLFHSLEASSAVMLHHGAMVEHELIGRFLGEFVCLVKYFAPDITIGTKGKDEYREIYSTTCHELAHASHFRQVGTEYWDKYITYILESYVKTGGMTYGDGTGNYAGHCEIGEMWAYYLGSRMFKDRYGGAFPTFGTSFWFYPQIFRYLDERGITPSEIFDMLSVQVTSLSELRNALLTAYPKKRTVIEQVFSRY